MSASSSAQDRQLSRGALIALVVGSMVGAGIFTLPAAFARSTGALGALIAWAIAGSGMLMLALVFQNLSRRKPEMDAGIYAYAKAGFGNYLGFSSAFGYWIACCLADVACLILIKATLGQFWPVFGDGSTPLAIATASVIVWGVHMLVLRGVKEAAALNTIATVAKLVPIAIFVVVVIAGFKADVFALNFWGGEAGSLSSVAEQVRQTMLVTVFVFVGIEGASVYSRYAKDRNDVGIATVLGFLGVLCLLVLVTVFSYGILLRPDLAALATPSMAGVMEAIVGPWGRVFVSIGLLISIAGNYLSWSLLAAEVLHSAAKNDSMPKLLARENKNRVPYIALWLTNSVIQFFLLVTWFAEQAFTIALKMTSAMTLLPYLLVAAYGAKLAYRGETYGQDLRGRRRDGVVAALASVYALAMLIAGGAKFLLLAALLYAPGSFLYFYARREQGLAVFSPAEQLVFGALCLAAMVALYALASGALTI
ncbi:MAG: amino acid permease [Paucibacter sp.]|nr:amino acid permease [Roseateles sp.]